MRLSNTWAWMTIFGLLLAGPIGCKKAEEELKTFDENEDHHGDEHAEGPHHGHLIEIGEEQYHAEMVLDHDTHTVTIYILGADGKTAQPISQTEIGFMPEGTSSESYMLAASPQESDPAGESSRFQIVDETLVEDLAALGYLHGSLELTIGEESFTPSIDIHGLGEEHDHEGDDHDGDHTDEVK